MTRPDGGGADEGTMDGDEMDRDASNRDEASGAPADGDRVDRQGGTDDGADRGFSAAVTETLDRLRSHPRDHRVALAVAAAVGLALAWLHWLGLIVGGALVGLVSRSLGRALLAGVGFGILVLAVFAVTLGGALDAALTMAPATYLTVGAAIGLPAFGSLVRGLG